MDNLIYAGFVLAGALTLLIEAYRNFNAPGAAHPFALHPILKTVEIRNLTTPSEAMVGFAIYAACYLVVYAVVLGSAEILQLVLDATRTEGEVGAIGGSVQATGDPLALAGRGFEKPLLVSAALIAFLSLGAVRPVETTLRGIAHRLSGIPGGVYKVITELQDFDFEKAVDSFQFAEGLAYPTPLASRFNDAADTPKYGPDTDETYSRLHAQVVRYLTAIDCLTEATSSTGSKLYFPIFQLETLTELSATLEAEVSDLETEIEAMVGKTAPEALAALKAVRQKAALVRQNTMAVFAVFYVRNNRSVFVDRSAGAASHSRAPYARAPEPIEQLRRDIAQRYNAEVNSFALGLFFATLLGALAIFWTYQGWYARNATGAAPRTELVLAVCDPRIDRTTYLDRLAAVDSRLVAEAGWTTERLAARPAIPCAADDARIATPGQIADFLRGMRTVMASATFFDTLRSAVLILVCVFFVLIGREARIDDQSWPKDWSFRQFPFLTLLGMSFFPGLIAVVVVAGTELLQQAYYVGKFDPELVTDLFQSNWVFFVMQFGNGMVLSFGALVVMDKHGSATWRWPKTLIVALCCAVAMALWSMAISYFTQSADPSYFLRAPEQLMTRHLRDAMIFGTVPALFFVIFAVFLELSEKPQESEQGAQQSEQASQLSKQQPPQRSGQPPQLSRDAPEPAPAP